MQVGALPYVLGVLQHCKDLHLHLVGAEATVLLAKIWIALNPSSAVHAWRLVSNVLPLILAHSSIVLQAEAQLVLADCLLCMASTADEVRAYGFRILEPLDNAAEGFGLVEAWGKAQEAYHRMALVLDAMNERELRNKAAIMFGMIEDHGEIPEHARERVVDHSRRFDAAKRLNF